MLVVRRNCNKVDSARTKFAEGHKPKWALRGYLGAVVSGEELIYQRPYPDLQSETVVRFRVLGVGFRVEGLGSRV